jgi:thiamine-monophosphate kinase
MDENQFLEYLRKSFPFSHGTGIGDDTSVVRKGRSYQLITKDILVENIHFKLDDMPLERLAAKSLAVNLSDIAAMGGDPQYYFLGLGYPMKIGVKNLYCFFKALTIENRKWGIELAGGDFSKSPLLFISITMIGCADNPIYRDQAQTEDLIGITGPIGESAIGLALLNRGITHPYYTDKHLIVEPEVNQGKILASHVHAMIDISDGLLIDLQRILHASAKGATINYEKIPIAPETREICRKYKLNEYETILAGGEDYRLLFTISRSSEKHLQKENIEYAIIGEIVDKRNHLQIFHHHKEIAVSKLGYDHFSAKNRPI